jgi:hypothetical protein
MGVHACNLSELGDGGKRILRFQVSLGKSQKPNKKPKKARGVAQMVQCLLSTLKSLGSKRIFLKPLLSQTNQVL